MSETNLKPHTYRVEPGSVLYRVLGQEARRQRSIVGRVLAGCCLAMGVTVWLMAMKWTDESGLGWLLAVAGPLILCGSCLVVDIVKHPGFPGEEDYRLTIASIDPEGRLGAKDWIYLGLDLTPTSAEERRAYHLRQAARYTTGAKASPTARGKARSRPAGAHHKDPAA